MEKKGFINIIFAIVIIVLVILAGYFAFVRPKISTPASNKAADWKKLIPEVQTIIGPSFLGVEVRKQAMSIAQTKDITGDGVPEALIYLGNSGAYTEYLTLIRLEKGKPVIARFKQKDGKVSPLIFLSGASVMNGESAIMLPEKSAIYAGHWSRTVQGEPYGRLTNCKVEAYQWNPQTKLFEFSQSLSDEIRQDYCQEMDN